jgi:hypothetical protein
MDQRNRSGLRTIGNFVRGAMPQLSIPYVAGRAGIVIAMLERVGPPRGPARTLVRLTVQKRPIARQMFLPTRSTVTQIQQFIVKTIARRFRLPQSAVMLAPPQVLRRLQMSGRPGVARPRVPTFRGFGR